MRRLKVGDRVVMNNSAKHFSWYDDKIRVILEFDGIDAIVRPGFNFQDENDGDDFDGQLNASYLKLYEPIENIKLEKFYDDYSGI